MGEPEPDQAPAPAVATSAPEPERAPDLLDRARDWIDKLSTWRSAKIALAVLLACAHLLAFAQAGRVRLNIPFDNAPGAHLQFTNPMVGALDGHPRQPPHWSRLVVSRFDAQHYIGFALRGLSACPTDPSKSNDGHAYVDCGLGWLPAYGVIGGAVSGVTGLEPDVALLLLALLGAIAVNLLWICPPMIQRLGRFEAFAVLIAWNCYPGAWNLVALQTESIVVALALGGFVMLLKERWIWAAALVGACTAFRLPTVSYALALGGALLVAAWQRRRAGTPRWWLPLLGLPLCGWGQLLTMIIFQIKLGNWHAFLDARFAFGDHNRLSRLVDLSYYMRGFGSQCADMVVFVGLVAIVVATWRRVVAGFNRVETTFLAIASAATAVIAIAGAMQYWGITRYMMLCPLPFLGAGVLAKHNRWLFVLWLVVCVGIYWHFELCSFITHGDAHACPCLGRIELSEPWAS